MGNAAPSKTTTYRKRVIVISSIQSKFCLLSFKEQVKACLEAPSDSWLKETSKSVLAAARTGDDLLDAELQLGVQVLPFEDFVDLLRRRVLKGVSQSVLRDVFSKYQSRCNAKVFEHCLKTLCSEMRDSFRLLPLISSFAPLRPEMALFVDLCLKAVSKPVAPPPPNSVYPWTRGNMEGAVRMTRLLDCVQVFQECGRRGCCECSGRRSDQIASFFRRFQTISHFSDESYRLPEVCFSSN